jgi:hypothetical protein
MTEILVSRPRPVSAKLPPVLSFCAGFIASFTIEGILR